MCKSSMELVAKARTHGNKFSMKCIACNKGVRCNDNPINSHNIQNARILKKLSVDNHVYMVSAQPTDEEFLIDLQKVGTNKVTIFRCLCGYHDKTIFSPIEDELYNGSAKQNMLFALKSLLYEYWKVEENYDFSKNTFPGAKRAQQKFLNDCQYCLNDIKMFNDMLENDTYNLLKSFSVTLNYETLFAVSSSLCIYTDFAGKKLCAGSSDYPYIHLTIFPENGKTNIIFSWLKKDNEYYQNFINQISKLDKQVLVDKLNLFMAMNIENIIISPKLVDTWNERQKKEFTYIQQINVRPDLTKFTFCVDNWLGQTTFNLFQNLSALPATS